jgi:ribosomal protein L31E
MIFFNILYNIGQIKFMGNNYENRLKELDSLIKCDKHDQAYKLVHTFIQEHIKENDQFKKDPNINKGPLWREYIENSILINEATILSYERCLERILYHQLKNLTGHFDAFISKLVELRKVIREVTEESNDYWLFWHLPKVLIRAVNNTHDEQKVYILFKNIQALPFLKNHETTVPMKRAFYNRVKNADYQMEIDKWLS